MVRSPREGSSGVLCLCEIPGEGHLSDNLLHHHHHSGTPAYQYRPGGLHPAVWFLLRSHSHQGFPASAPGPAAASLATNVLNLPLFSVSIFPISTHVLRPAELHLLLFPPAVQQRDV